MNETVDDLWALHEDGETIAIPVNIGWNKKGDAIMGRGVALEAAIRFPFIKPRWGTCCRNGKAATPVTALPSNLVMFPTKTLREEAPWMSWDQPSSVTLIARSLEQLARITEPIYLPLVGTGNGQLAANLVLEMIRKILAPTPHILVHRKSGAKILVS